MARTTVLPVSAKTGPLSTKYKSDRTLLRAQVVNAGLDVLKQDVKLVDPKRIAAILGLLFWRHHRAGTGARSGADIVGVVSFHGGLSSPTPADAKNIKCAGALLPRRG